MKCRRDCAAIVSGSTHGLGISDSFDPVFDKPRWFLTLVGADGIIKKGSFVQGKHVVLGVVRNLYLSRLRASDDLVLSALSTLSRRSF